MDNTFFCFKDKDRELYYNHGLLVDAPKDANPKFGDQGSAFMYADDFFEGNPQAKMDFRDTYEICRIGT